jgi:hypothetical protein
MLALQRGTDLASERADMQRMREKLRNEAALATSRLSVPRLVVALLLMIIFAFAESITPGFISNTSQKESIIV